MEFTLTQDHTINTDLIGPDNRVYYSVETPWEMFSKNSRIIGVKEYGPQVIGGIEWHSFGDTKMAVNGRQLLPMSSGVFSQ